MSHDQTEQVDSRVEGRLKVLTEAGQAWYEENLKKLKSNFDKVWSSIETVPEKIKQCSDNLVELKNLDHELFSYSQKYLIASDELLSFLTRTSTRESFAACDEHVQEYGRGREIIEQLHKQIKDLRMSCMETLSASSLGSLKTRSRASTSSRAKSETQKQRIKVEVQRASLKFVEKETELQKQITDLQSQLSLLGEQRKVAIAEVELNAAENLSPKHSMLSLLNDLPPHQVKEERVASYIDEQFGHSGINAGNNSESDSQSERRAEPQVQLNPNAPSYVPAVLHGNDNTHSSVINNVTQFLLKKDLLLSRFSNYDDKPESYACWKSSFKAITKELAVSSFEEIDLLIKWLGPQSSKFALSIRAANANDPKKGLEKIWERLEDRYGCAELVETALKLKLQNFPKLTLKDSKKLFELSDILSEIECIKENPKYTTMLAYYDSSSGIIPIINKLPYNLQEKWTSQASNYKKRYGVSYPPFTFLVSFIQGMSKIRNDPGFQYESNVPRQRGAGQGGPFVQVKKTGTMSQGGSSGSRVVWCPIHKSSKHSLEKCFAFKGKSFTERRKILKKLSICFRCCESKSHMARDCKVRLKCNICQSDTHHTAMHIVESDRSQLDCKSLKPSQHGGEKLVIKEDSVTGVCENDKPSDDCLNSVCTQICNSGFKGKSCAKIVLVRVFQETDPERSLQLYAIIDDQSNRCLAKPELFDFFGVDSARMDYTISSCSGLESASGRRGSGFIVQSLDENTTLHLPTLIECENIPSSRDEIPTPDVADNYTHLKCLVPCIPPIDNDASILLLIGRDLPKAHHVLDQKIGVTSPYAQKLHLGWVLVGESCLDKVHAPDSVIVNRTYVLPSGRASIFSPCDSAFLVQEQSAQACQTSFGSNFKTIDTSDDLFERTPADNKPGLSIDDREFLGSMTGSFTKDSSNQWSAPLPFRSNRSRLPNNRNMALNRALILDRSLGKDPVKSQHFYTFMDGILKNKFAEIAPPLLEQEECWFLPIFGVYNDKKPGKVRVVFDSSAKFEGVSLNDVLLTGPDLTNNLIGVLMRFRKEKIAITADIRQMFFCFLVDEKHRNFLRFLWHENNDPTKPLVEFRMCRHVFGNASSPAIATLGLRKSVDSLDICDDVKYFVRRNFYVDDALTSVPSVEEAVSLMSRTQSALFDGGGLHLHKVSSNSPEVIQSFPVQDRSGDLKEIDLSMEEVPLQRSLGISWNLQLDTFTFQVNLGDTIFTKRGVLSTLHTIFDPLGFVAPVILQGRLLFRSLVDTSSGWDDLLPLALSRQWDQWTSSLYDLSHLKIMRPYVPFSVVNSPRREIHVFSDASEKAVSAVAYLRVLNAENMSQIGFVLGKSKLAPKSGHTIPRLELCAAVLACEIANTVTDHLDTPIDDVCFYTDSKVVLGYISNHSRRFYTYVSNRVDKILKLSKFTQWNYVPSQLNPADVGSRGISAKELASSMWLKPPLEAFHYACSNDITYSLVDPDDDSEIRPIVTLKLDTLSGLDISRFEKYSSWNSLVSGLSLLRQMAKKKSFHADQNKISTDEFRSTELFIIQQVQQKFFSRELLKLHNNEKLPKDSSLLQLNPFLDSDNVLRVGGRLNKSEFGGDFNNPIIIPKNSHIATLLICHYHNRIHHQGRHFTEGALRNAGYWVIAAKRQISNIVV